MAITYKEAALFSSGPARSRAGPQGSLVVPLLSIGQTLPGSVALGALELAVIVEGRLVEAEGSTLASQVAAIEAALVDGLSPGTLIDEAGREHAEMRFVRFEPTGPVDGGRARSLAYEARFIRLL